MPKTASMYHKSACEAASQSYIHLYSRQWQNRRTARQKKYISVEQNFLMSDVSAKNDVHNRFRESLLKEGASMRARYGYPGTPPPRPRYAVNQTTPLSELNTIINFTLFNARYISPSRRPTTSIDRSRLRMHLTAALFYGTTGGFTRF